MEIAISFLLGAAASWLITHIYHKRAETRAETESREGIIAARLDGCKDGDKTFLVALDDLDEPLPLYSLIAVEYELLDGERASWASNACIMGRSIDARESFSLYSHQCGGLPNSQKTIGLTKRGKENAAYLRRKHVKWAKFTQINKDDSTREGLFAQYGPVGFHQQNLVLKDGAPVSNLHSELRGRLNSTSG